MDENKKSNFIGIKNKDLNTFSEVEKDYAISLEYDPQAAHYFPAQTGLRIESNPDKFIDINFWVIYENKLERLVYIHKGDLTLDHWKEATSCLRNKSAVFTPVSEQNIQREPRCSNLSLLWKYADAEIQIGYLTLLNKFFAETKLPNLGKLQKFLGEQEIDKNFVYTFIFHKVLVCNINDFKLSQGTIILLNPNLEIAKNWNRNFEEPINMS